MNFKKYYEMNMEATKQKLRTSVLPDNLIDQCVSNVDELNRAANMLTKRLREWFELENPEFSRSISNNESFSQMLKQFKDSKTKDSMGAILDKKDDQQIRKLASEIEKLHELRKSHEQYLEQLMKMTCPNIHHVAGAVIGAKLISHTKTLKRLSMMTASTIQILGAEKALFRHMKTGARAPKHGLILQHKLLQQAKPKDRGRVARLLADKIAIAAKVDFFKGKFVGDKLKKEIMKKLNTNY